MKHFREQMQQQLDVMVATGKLFRVDISGEKVWQTYLISFDKDPIFRDPEKTIHNCNHCRNFIRRYGNIVAIGGDNNIITLFEFIGIEEFKPVSNKLNKIIQKASIKDVFFETYEELKNLPYEALSKLQGSFRLGIHENVKRYTKEDAKAYGGGVVKENQIIKFEHMSLLLDKEFVKRGPSSIEAIMSEYRDAKNVFKRAMEEISIDTLELVKDLIQQGSLLDGDTHIGKIDSIIIKAQVYKDVPSTHQNSWCWRNSYEFVHAKFKNTLIGVLCSELSEGVNINKACQNWNKRVDPINYMKASAPITQKQIKEAKIFVEDNGYEMSFKRRIATIDDIKSSEILHINSEGGVKSADISIFDDVKSTSTRHKRSEFDGIEKVAIDVFMKDILPGCSSVEVFLKNNHEDNMVTLTTSEVEDSKLIFKWNNNYSWTFNGNLAGKSLIKDTVKSLGGKVDGVLRFSIMWAEDTQDNSDLDAHCIEPNSFEIYFSQLMSANTRGHLDIDITDPQEHKYRTKKDVVENITWPSLDRMASGKYELFVHQYAAKSSKGFKAEIEFEGNMYSYIYTKALGSKINVSVANVILKNGEFIIKHILPAIDGVGVRKEFYNLESNRFHKVNLMCLSPNHWGDNKVGNKYYLFMLEGAQSNKLIRSFHNENLKSDLVTHRKVMEVLANTTMIESAPKELSGLGFNATVRDELILRLKGSHKRVIKVKF